MRLGELEVEVSGHGPPVVLVHGIGLGPWLWRPWLPLFAERGLRTVAVRLPDGAANQDFEQTVTAVASVVRTFPEPILVGHSMGGLVAQVLATRVPVRALALICPLPPGQIRVLPSREAIRHGGGLVRALLAGRPLRVDWDLYRRLGLDVMDEATARACFARTEPWSNALARDLAFRRPHVDVSRLHVPTLVCIGKQDRLVAWQKARIIGDLYEAVTWRYDELGHMPPYEPGGDRMGRDLAGWLAAPARPAVLESEGYGPAEGVGHTLRAERRGEAARHRSAYGQKGAARGSGAGTTG
jgi:pimeloyl-ACP methyl ester carboxylesterase